MIVTGLAALGATSSRAADSGKTVLEQAVILSPVALPIIVDGVVVNYVIVTVKILLAPTADASVLSEKEPYFRDALVRAAHRAPFVLRNDYNHIDEVRLKAVMLREASAITGPNVVRGVAVVEQSAQHNLASPRPGPANPH
jgi:hypothetical protein